MMSRMWIALAAMTMLSLLMAACAPEDVDPDAGDADDPGAEAPEADDDLMDITVAFSIGTPDAAGAYLWVGEALGYYEEEGLDVNLVTLDGSVETARQVATGQVDYSAGGTLEPVPQFNEQGDPLQAIHQYAYEPIFYMGIPAGSDIEEPSELAGHSVGIVAAGSGAVPVLEFLLTEYDVSPGEVDTIPIGLGGQAVSAIEQGEVDAVMFWDTAYVDFERAGLELEYFTTDELDEGYASMGAFFNRDRADELGEDTTVSFLRALNKSLVFTQTNPEAAIQAMGSIEPLVLEDEEASVQKLEARVQLHELPPEADGQLGWGSEDGWERLQAVLLRGDVIEEAVPLEELWNDEFLEAANDFDHEAIEQEAVDYTS